MRTLDRRAIVATSAALLTLMPAAPLAAQEPDDHLARVLDAGVIRMATDPSFPPLSELVDDELVGFDIDVGTEIAARLGVEIAFETPTWSLIAAGSWGDRWDFSVGSVSITSVHESVIDFTRPYYYDAPAQMAAHADLGYESLEHLASQAICTGEATTYFEWMNGTLDFGSATPSVIPPEGSTPVTRPDDDDCAQEWESGGLRFQGWLSSSATVQAAIDAGLPVVVIGEPLFAEPLAVAFDKTVEDNDSLVAAVDRVVADMHADGTLSELSLKWFGEDLTQAVAG